MVTKDIPGNCVAAGIPYKAISSFEDYVSKRKACKELSDEVRCEELYLWRKDKV